MLFIKLVGSINLINNMNWLDPRQLIAFKTLLKTGSFTTAARSLHLTQSAISHSIKALEKELGCELFHRVNKKIQLTAAGEALFDNIEPIFSTMERARQAVMDVSSWGRGRVRVGGSTTCCQYILPNVLREFRACFPECQISIEPGNSPKALDDLMRNETDLALVLEPDHDDMCTFRPMFEDSLAFVVAPSHPLALKNPIRLSDLEDHTFVIFNKNTTTYRMVMKFFGNHGIHPKNTLELGSVEAIKELVKIGYGFSLLAPWTFHEELDRGMLTCIHPEKFSLHRRWGIATVKGRKLSLMEETFTGLCLTVAENFQDTHISPGEAGMADKK